MTSEVVVMNREGIAIAADSVVTYGGSKTFDTANKVFMLAPNYPVGIMIYNNATFMGLPWEIIIKHYRDYIQREKKRFDTLVQYSKNFIEFLESKSNKFSKDEQQEFFIFSGADFIFTDIAKVIWREIEIEFYDTGQKIEYAKIVEITDKAVRDVYHQIESIKFDYSKKEYEKWKACFKKNFLVNINKVRDFYLGELPLSEENIRQLEEICLLFFAKPLVTTSFSGIVFVGYGDLENLPTCASCFIESLICDKLRYSVDSIYNIKFSGASAYIIPFAQADTIETFIKGRHTSYPNAIFNKLKGKIPDDEISPLLDSVEAEFRKTYTKSIMDAVDGLPKEDLAMMAETLVSLTSFMRKVSMVQETVGGPVDVAVISKKDGFVWIKRKNYFDLEKNLHYKVNYL